MKVKQLGTSLFYVKEKESKLLIQTYPLKIFELKNLHQIPKNLISSPHLQKVITSADKPNYFSLELIFSTACNLECTYCYAKEKKTGCYGLKTQNMDKKTVKRAIDLSLAKLTETVSANNSNQGVFDLYFMGGEPLLNKENLFYCLRYAYLEKEKIFKRCGINIKIKPAISTNGVLIDDEIAQFFKKYNFEYVGITIDGSNHNQYRKFPDGSGTLNKVLDGARRLLKYGVNLKIISVVSPGEVNKIDKNIDYFDSLKILSKACRVSVIPRAPNINELYRACPIPQQTIKRIRTGQQKTKFSKAEIQIFANKILEVTKKYDIDERDLKRKIIELIYSGGSKYHCPAAIWKISVVPNGSIYPCHQLVNISKFYMGNIFSDKVSKNKEFRQTKELFLKRDVYHIDKCKKCAFQTICPPLVDCPARSYLEEKSLYKTPQYCGIYYPYIKNVFENFINQKIGD